MGALSDALKRRKLPMFIGATGAAMIMFAVIYIPDLSETHLDILLFSLGLLYSSQCIVFAVARELSPPEAAATAMATANMIVMLGAMLLQPFVGRLLDISAQSHQGATVVQKTLGAVAESIYTAADYQFALSIIPLGIFLAVILTFFLRETYAEISN